MWYDWASDVCMYVCMYTKKSAMPTVEGINTGKKQVPAFFTQLSASHSYCFQTPVSNTVSVHIATTIATLS